MQPNKERIRLWVEALESGNYKQGVGTLRNPSFAPGGYSYCCLGVAIEVAVNNGYSNETAESMHSYGGILTTDLLEWYGLSGVNTYVGDVVIGVGHGVRATEANDELYWEFPRIAQAIRDRYLEEE
jgi:hypothetical protein